MQGTGGLLQMDIEQQRVGQNIKGTFFCVPTWGGIYVNWTSIKL